jgi:hypothetical protein
MFNYFEDMQTMNKANMDLGLLRSNLHLLELRS